MTYNEFEGKSLRWDQTLYVQGPNIQSPMQSLFGGFTVYISIGIYFYRNIYSSGDIYNHRDIYTYSVWEDQMKIGCVIGIWTSQPGRIYTLNHGYMVIFNQYSTLEYTYRTTMIYILHINIFR